MSTNNVTSTYPAKVLPQSQKRATIKRKVEIYSEIARHLKAILYLVAELHLGEKPEKA